MAYSSRRDNTPRRRGLFKRRLCIYLGGTILLLFVLYGSLSFDSDSLIASSVKKSGISQGWSSRRDTRTKEMKIEKTSNIQSTEKGGQATDGQRNSANVDIKKEVDNSDADIEEEEINDNNDDVDDDEAEDDTDVKIERNNVDTDIEEKINHIDPGVSEDESNGEDDEQVERKDVVANVKEEINNADDDSVGNIREERNGSENKIKTDTNIGVNNAKEQTNKSMDDTLDEIDEGDDEGDDEADAVGENTVNHTLVGKAREQNIKEERNSSENNIKPEIKNGVGNAKEETNKSEDDEIDEGNDEGDDEADEVGETNVNPKLVAKEREQNNTITPIANASDSKHPGKRPENNTDGRRRDDEIYKMKIVQQISIKIQQLVDFFKDKLNNSTLNTTNIFNQSDSSLKSINITEIVYRFSVKANNVLKSSQSLLETYNASLSNAKTDAVELDKKKLVRLYSMDVQDLTKEASYILSKMNKKAIDVTSWVQFIWNIGYGAQKLTGS